MTELVGTTSRPVQTRAGANLTLPATALVQSFERSLRAENKADKTLRAYLSACRLLFGYLAAQGMPQDVAHVKREHVEAFIADELERHAPATAHQRYRSLRAFFGWCVDEGELKVSPMQHMKAPALPETMPQVLTEAQITALLKTTQGGRDFIEGLRDTAIIRLLLDTGMRLSECAGLCVDDLDFTVNTATVVGKGRRQRSCPFGRKTAQALDRYLRARVRHPKAAEAGLWLGHRGTLGADGLYQMVRRRGEQAGMPWLHPHLARHFAADGWLRAGGQESDLMSLLGWRSRSMVTKYARSTAAERARLAHQRLALMDRI